MLFLVRRARPGENQGVKPTGILEIEPGPLNRAATSVQIYRDVSSISVNYGLEVNIYKINCVLGSPCRVDGRLGWR